MNNYELEITVTILLNLHGMWKVASEIQPYNLWIGIQIMTLYVQSYTLKPCQCIVQLIFEPLLLQTMIGKQRVSWTAHLYIFCSLYSLPLDYINVWWKILD